VPDHASGLKQEILSLGDPSAALDQDTLLVGIQADAQGLGDHIGDFTLDPQGVSRRPVIYVRPSFGPVCAIDELGAYPQHRWRPPDATGQDVANTKLGGRRFGVGVPHDLGRCPRDHLQARDPRQDST